MPTPRPEMSETVSAVEKPGRKSRLSISLSVELRVGGDQPLLDRDRLARAGRSMPAPSSATSMTMRPERCAADSLHLALRGLAGGDARVSGRLERRDRRRCGSCGSADRPGARSRCGRPRSPSPSVFRRTVLAGRVGDLAHDARHALEHRLHRLGADRHHAFLDLARQLLELVEAGGDARELARAPPPARAATASPG